jgi:hypothetical protein
MPTSAKERTGTFTVSSPSIVVTYGTGTAAGSTLSAVTTPIPWCGWTAWSPTPTFAFVDTCVDLLAG